MKKYEKIIFDFHYLKQTDYYEGVIEESSEVFIHLSRKKKKKIIILISLSLSLPLSFFLSFFLSLFLSLAFQLLDLDHDFKENNFELLHRFYLLFESVWKYVQDLARYYNEVEEGLYIQVTLDMILASPDGKQLAAEVIF